MSWEGFDALVSNVGRLRIATDAAGIGLSSWKAATGETAMDERGHTLWGVPRDGPFTVAHLPTRVVPPDLGRVQTAFPSTRTTPGPYQIDFRILRPDGNRWVYNRWRGAEAGIAGRIMSGVFLDSTARKDTEEARDMPTGEMNDRVKDPSAIAASLGARADLPWACRQFDQVRVFVPRAVRLP